MGLLLSVFSFGYALCQLPIGMVMERFELKRFMALVCSYGR